MSGPRFDWREDRKRRKAEAERTGNASAVAPADLSELTDEQLDTSFRNALARLSLVAEGRVAPASPSDRQGASHDGGAPPAVGAGVRLIPLYNGAAGEPLLSNRIDAEKLNHLSVTDRIARLREWYARARTTARRRELAEGAMKLLELEQKRMPSDLRIYDGTDSMRREIGEMNGSFREVADQFIGVSHESVRQWRKERDERNERRQRERAYTLEDCVRIDIDGPVDPQS